MVIIIAITIVLLIIIVICRASKLQALEAKSSLLSPGGPASRPQRENSEDYVGIFRVEFRSSIEMLPLIMENRIEKIVQHQMEAAQMGFPRKISADRR